MFQTSFFLGGGVPGLILLTRASNDFFFSFFKIFLRMFELDRSPDLQILRVWFVFIFYVVGFSVVPGFLACCVPLFDVIPWGVIVFIIIVIIVIAAVVICCRVLLMNVLCRLVEGSVHFTVVIV